MKWIDFSKYGFEMYLLKYVEKGTQKKTLLVSGGVNHSVHERLLAVGFNEKSAFLVGDPALISIDDIMKVFPRSFLIQADPERVVIDTQSETISDSEMSNKQADQASAVTEVVKDNAETSSGNDAAEITATPDDYQDTNTSHRVELSSSIEYSETENVSADSNVLVDSVEVAANQEIDHERNEHPSAELPSTTRIPSSSTELLRKTDPETLAGTAPRADEPDGQSGDRSEGDAGSGGSLSSKDGSTLIDSNVSDGESKRSLDGHAKDVQNRSSNRQLDSVTDQDQPAGHTDEPESSTSADHGSKNGQRLAKKRAPKKAKRQPSVQKEYFDLHALYAAEDRLSLSKRFSVSDRFDQNIEAINTLHEIRQSGRPAGEDEKSRLALYSGWGGLASIFDDKPYNYPSQKKTFNKLVESNILTAEHAEAIKASVLDSHYTPVSFSQSVWRALERMGFEGGQILEPSVGTGHFIGTMSKKVFDNSTIQAVELDGVTARITQTLYPGVNVKNVGFENSNTPKGIFDLVVGNVPFGNYKVFDPEYSHLNLNIHNYFIVKSLDSLREGGVCALMTSTFTMDAQTTKARQLMYERGDLLTAIRLPENAFRSQAGTSASVDILFFKKVSAEESAERIRLMKSAPDDLPRWVSSPAELDRESPEITGVSNFFIENPDQVIGQFSVTSTQFGFRQVCTAVDMDSIPARLEQALSGLEEGLYKPASINYSSQSEYFNRDTLEFESKSEMLKYRKGSLLVKDDAIFCVMDSNIADRKVDVEEVQLDAKQQEVLKQIIAIRDQALILIDLQSNHQNDAHFAGAMTELNELYDDFVEQHGHFNSRANKRLVNMDLQAGFILNLETDTEDGIEKSALFSKRVIRPTTIPEKASSVKDALNISLSYKGIADRPLMMRLMGEENTDENWLAVLDQCEGRVLKDPVTQQYIAREVYLSGDVRKKLAIAEQAIDIDPEYEENVNQLRSVVPEDLTPSDINVQMGASWIPESDVKDFIRQEVFAGLWTKPDDIPITYAPTENAWKVDTSKISSHALFSERSISEWGTLAKPAHKLLQLTLMRMVPTVTREVKGPDGQSYKVTDTAATLSAINKQQMIETRFSEWLWSDEKRTDRLLKNYNDRFNCFVKMEPDGQHLTLPGMNPLISLRPHQKNAVWRAMISPNTLYAHEVGTGKTFTMIATLMEFKRIGRANRPMMVVKKNTIGQIESAARDLYPGAHIAVMDGSGLTKEKRRSFLSGLMANDFDLAIMSYEAFTSMPLSPEVERGFIQEQLFELTEMLSGMEEKSFSRKQIEQSKKRLETRLARLSNLEIKDDAVYLDEVRPDAICFDESHLLKNLDVQSRYTEFSSQGSKRSMDAMSKMHWLAEQHGKGMNLIFSSGTPISNTFAEAFTLLRYLGKDILLEKIGGSSNALAVHPDRFFANFIKRYTAPEIGVDGQYKISSRYEIINIPELMGMLNNFMDIRFADDLGIERPDINRITVTCEPTELHKVFSLEIAQRASAIKNKQVKPEEDNYLKIASDGRKAALDMRLVDPSLPELPGTKIHYLVDNVVAEYNATKDFKGVQAIFCDQGTPGGSGFNLYADIKTKLIDAGISASDIAFAHDAKTDAQREALFDRVNKGDIRVIIGSTEKMGTGTNMQEKLSALHHLDPPSNMRPSDLEQRDGRINRQGNTNSNAKILIYSTIDSFDLFIWNLMKFKQSMVNRIMRNDRSVRTYSEDEDGANFESIMAVTTGNELIKNKIVVDQKVSLLSALQAEHSDKKHFYRRTISDNIVLLEKGFLGTQSLNMQKQLADAIVSAKAEFLQRNPAMSSSGLSPWQVNGVFVPVDDLNAMKKSFRADAKEKIKGFVSEVTIKASLTYYGLPVSWKIGLDLESNSNTFRESFAVESKEHGIRVNSKHMQTVLTTFENAEYTVKQLGAKIENLTTENETLMQYLDDPFEQEAELIELKTQQAEMAIEVEKAAEEFAKQLKESNAITNIGDWKMANFDKLQINATEDDDLSLDDLMQSRGTMNFSEMAG